MPDLKNPKAAIPVVLMAGILWSFGPYVVRHIDQPDLVPWQYLFARGTVIFIILKPFDERTTPELSAFSIIETLQHELLSLKDVEI